MPIVLQIEVFDRKHRLQRRRVCSHKYFSMVWAKLLASGRRQGCSNGASSAWPVVSASGVYSGFPGLVAEAVPFQLELGRDLLSGNLEDTGPSP